MILEMIVGRTRIIGQPEKVRLIRVQFLYGRGIYVHAPKQRVSSNTTERLVIGLRNFLGLKVSGSLFNRWVM